MGKNKSSAAASSSANKDGNTAPAPVKPAQQIQVRHILVAKRAQLDACLAQLREGTASFDALAREHSLDKARQGVFFYSFCFLSP